MARCWCRSWRTSGTGASCGEQALAATDSRRSRPAECRTASVHRAIGAVAPVLRGPPIIPGLDWPPWSDASGTPVALLRPPTIDGQGGWFVVRTASTDEDGWLYGTHFERLSLPRPGGRASKRANDQVRSRVWRRLNADQVKRERTYHAFGHVPPRGAVPQGRLPTPRPPPLARTLPPPQTPQELQPLQAERLAAGVAAAAAEASPVHHGHGAPPHPPAAAPPAAAEAPRRGPAKGQPPPQRQVSVSREAVSGSQILSALTTSIIYKQVRRPVGACPAGLWGAPVPLPEVVRGCLP